MYVQHNTEAPSRNHSCSGIAIIITYSACVCVALGTSIHYTCAILQSVGCPALSFFHIISYMALFSKNFIEHKMCVSIFSTNFVWNIFRFKEKWARYDQKHILIWPDLTVQCPLFLSDFNEK